MESEKGRNVREGQIEIRRDGDRRRDKEEIML